MLTVSTSRQPPYAQKLLQQMVKLDLVDLSFAQEMEPLVSHGNAIKLNHQDIGVDLMVLSIEVISWRPMT